MYPKLWLSLAQAFSHAYTDTSNDNEMGIIERIINNTTTAITGRRASKETHSHITKRETALCEREKTV